MNRAEYEAYLRSDEWREYRRRQMERANWVCQRCFQSRAEQLHHRHYETVGHETPACTIPVCPECHAFLHRKSLFDPKLRFGTEYLWEMLLRLG